MRWVLSSEQVEQERERLFKERRACEERRDEVIRAATEQYEGEVHGIDERLTFLATLEALEAELLAGETAPGGGEASTDKRSLRQKDIVYRAVRAHPDGIGRPGIVNYIRDEFEAEIPPNQVTTYLWRLKTDRLVRVERRTWFPLEKPQ